jgi:hypothetical protein
MKERFRSGLDRIQADEAMISRAAARLRDEIPPHQLVRNKQPNVRALKKVAVAACLAVLFVTGGLAYATPTAYLSVDINPSIELGINCFSRVVCAEGLNDDGQEILGGIDVGGMGVEQAVSLIVSAATDKGYLDEAGTSVVSLTVAADDQKKADQLTKEAEEGTETALAENQTAAEVSQATISKARRDAAIKAGISPGKMNLVQQLWEATENGGAQAADTDADKIMDFAQERFGASDRTYAESNVKDIMKAIKSARNGHRAGAGERDDPTQQDSDRTSPDKANAYGNQKKTGADEGDYRNTTRPISRTRNNAPVDR